MRKHFILSLLLFTLAVCLQGCSDDDKAPVDANDNFVTSVAFTVSNKTYDAVIENNTITITVPYTVSLKDATVEFIYTPSAKILPDPATVRDWDNERVFRVTSYNGDENQYTYRVIKDDIRQEGDVTLKNASEIAAFAESGVTVVKGNLIIGTDEGEAIESITSLSKLKQVEGNIVIKNSYKGTDLTGLDKVTSIGGLQVGSVDSFSKSLLHQVSLKSLTTITGDLIVCNNETQWVIAESLTTVGGNVVIRSSALQSIQMDKLSRVTGSYDIQSAVDENGDRQLELGGKMVALSFPELLSVGGTLSANYLAALKSIRLEKLQTAGAVLFKTLPLPFEKINLPAIKTVEGDLNISSSTVYHPIGSSIEGNEVLTSFDGFDKLERVGGTLTFSYFTEATKVPDVSKISLGGYCLDHMEKISSVFDFSKTVFEKQGGKSCEIKLSYTPITRIIGRKTMDCELNLDHIDISKGIPALENIEIIDGFTLYTDRDTRSEQRTDLVFNFKKVIHNISINARPEKPPHYSFPNLEEVQGSFWLFDAWAVSFVNLYSNFSAPRLTSVGGQFFIAKMGSLWQSLDNVDLGSLKTVGCADHIEYYDGILGLKDAPTFSVTLSHPNGGNLELKSLERVGGRGMRVGIYYVNKGITGLSCQKLKKVDGKLTITGSMETNSAWWDDQLKSLDFPNIAEVGSVSIEYFTVLKDFKTFAPLFTNSTLPDGNWRVAGCGYNPDYNAMKAGKYAQP